MRQLCGAVTVVTNVTARTQLIVSAHSLSVTQSGLAHDSMRSVKAIADSQSLSERTVSAPLQQSWQLPVLQHGLRCSLADSLS